MGIRRGKNMTPEKLTHVRISDLHESGFNESIYRPVRSNDPEVRKLALSIKQHGLLEPLVITQDNFIISGHRRRLACEMAGLKEVSCETLPITSEDPRFIKYLREYNRQRVKGIEEVIQESIVDADGEERDIASNLMTERLKQSEISSNPFEIIGEKKRSKVKGNRPLLDSIIKIIEKKRDFWPLSDRKLHYELLNDPPLKHLNKPDSVYRNDKKSYRVLVDVLTRGRLTGEIPWESIADITRPVVTWKVYPNPTPFIENQFQMFMKGYFRDTLRSQPNHIEIVGEKNTLQSTIQPIAMKYCVPYTLGRGFSSITPRYEMAQRYLESGKNHLIILLLSDFDPDGEEIAQSFARSIRDDFGLDKVHPIKIALREDQVKNLKLKKSFEKAKTTSPNYRKFVNQYDLDVYELEAEDDNVLQNILEDAIKDVLNIDLYNDEINRENEDFLQLARERKKLKKIWGKQWE